VRRGRQDRTVERQGPLLDVSDDGSIDQSIKEKRTSLQESSHVATGTAAAREAPLWACSSTTKPNERWPRRPRLSTTMERSAEADVAAVALPALKRQTDSVVGSGSTTGADSIHSNGAVLWRWSGRTGRRKARWSSENLVGRMLAQCLCSGRGATSGRRPLGQASGHVLGKGGLRTRKRSEWSVTVPLEAG
jgi:hypothetical protein